jgi:hypothetical protein
MYEKNLVGTTFVVASVNSEKALVARAFANLKTLNIY